MPRPKTKNDLLELSQQNFKKLNELIDDFPKEHLNENFPKGTLNRNTRDVLGHLHHWHLMFLSWYKVGMKGDKPAMPAEGYSWKTVSDLNKLIWEKCQPISLQKTRKSLNASYEEIQLIIQAHSEEELFEKKRYKWTGSTSLGSYLISATSSHYDWAYKLIKKAGK